MENKNDQIREEVLQAVEGLTDEQLNEELEKGRWTIMQVLDHLYLMERVVTSSITEQLAEGEHRRVSDKPIQLTVDRSTKVEAPSFVEPSKAFITLADMKEKLAQSRQALHQIADEADDNMLEHRAYPHPAFGELSLKQWIPFIGYHEKRHLEQIEELKKHLQ
ncbi:DinB family protein [Virgibacillus halophilus]|uniref:DinB family protein n=1 Tax=Tigheibacillus halophilus TaxID=361280 RepID=A0ABU5CAY1_9BACI|nr:DinB family protein [Virgibacillus halophilus]